MSTVYLCIQWDKSRCSPLKCLDVGQMTQVGFNKQTEFSIAFLFLTHLLEEILECGGLLSYFISCNTLNYK